MWSNTPQHPQGNHLMFFFGVFCLFCFVFYFIYLFFGGWCFLVHRNIQIKHTAKRVCTVLSFNYDLMPDGYSLLTVIHLDANCSTLAEMR